MYDVCCTVSRRSSGVAGPLAAQGGGQICRPFFLGFWNWRACLKHKSHVMSTVTLVCRPQRFVFLARKHIWNLQSEFSRDYFFLIFGVFRPFAAPSKCRPVRPAPSSLRHCAVCSCPSLLDWVDLKTRLAPFENDNLSTLALTYLLSTLCETESETILSNCVGRHACSHLRSWLRVKQKQKHFQNFSQSF